jgi:hypothetical protein
MSHNLSPKDKAKELVQKFRIFVGTSKDDDNDDVNNYLIGKGVAKKCALLNVDELIEEHNFNSKINWNVKQIKYWEAVKSELLNYKTG